MAGEDSSLTVGLSPPSATDLMMENYKFMMKMKVHGADGFTCHGMGSSELEAMQDLYEVLPERLRQHAR
ncbi:hypothetical protein E4U41_004095 [Claviceps citrina]|nr:hypothetical protein E4U41_004095 [Claviceps citrina]